MEPGHDDQPRPRDAHPHPQPGTPHLGTARPSSPGSYAGAPSASGAMAALGAKPRGWPRLSGMTVHVLARSGKKSRETPPPSKALATRRLFAGPLFLRGRTGGVSARARFPHPRHAAHRQDGRDCHGSGPARAAEGRVSAQPGPRPAHSPGSAPARGLARWPSGRRGAGYPLRLPAPRGSPIVGLSRT